MTDESALGSEPNPPLTNVGEAAGMQILNGITDVEINPNELQELFNHPHPLLMTEAQRAVVVEGLRRSRGEYLVTKEKKAAKRAYKTADDSFKVSLADLDLKLEDLL